MTELTTTFGKGRAILPLIILSTIMIAGCSTPGGAATASGGDPSSPFAVFAAHLSLTGELKVKGTFTDTLTGRHETCDDYVNGRVAATTLYVVPTPNDAITVDGHTVMYTAGIPLATSGTSYHGPGTYSGASALVSVLLIDSTGFLPGNDASAVITISPNGSGSLSFVGLIDDSTNATEAGTVTWSCTSRGPSATSAPGGDSSSGGATRGPLLTGSAEISGAYQAKGTFRAHPAVLVGSKPEQPNAPDTCADYARGFAQNTTSFAAPEVQTAGATTIYISVTLSSGYHGPGVYTSASTPMLRGAVAVGIGDLNGAGYVDNFHSGLPGTTTLTVKADGSGTLAFSNWGSDATVISGSASWVCA